MRTKLVGWFFLFLVCSSVAHEYQKIKESLPQNNKAVSPFQKALLEAFGGLKGKLGDAIEIEDAERDEALKKTLTLNPISYIGTSTLFALCDNIANVAIIFEPASQLALFCDGNSGTGVLINCATNQAFYIPLGIWFASLTTFSAFIASLSLSAVLTLSTNVVINIFLPSMTVLNLCSKVLSALSYELFVQVSANLSAALNLAITTCTNIMVYVNVTLGGLLSFASTGYVVIKGGLNAFIAVLAGLVDLFISSGLSVSTCVSLGIVLNIGTILGCPDALTAFQYVCLQLGAHFNLAVTLSLIINNIAIFLRICVYLGGNVYTGVNGIFQVIAAIYLFIYAHITLDACLTIIIKVCVEITASISITAALNAIQALISAQVAVYNNAAGFATLTNFITGLLFGTLTVLGVAISTIVSLLTGVISTVLDLVVSIVAVLTAFITSLITVAVYWSTLLKCILFLLNSVVGRVVINILIPGLGILINPLSPCLNILAGLVLTILQVLVTLNLLGLVACLQSVPLLNQIYTAVATSLSSVTGASLASSLSAPSASSQYAAISNWIPGIINLGC